MDVARIARPASAHRGVFAQPFLDTVGVDPSRAAHEVRAGRWIRIHEGVFAMAGTPDSFGLRAEAALAAIPTAALGLRAAATVHRVEACGSGLDLVVPPGGRNRLEGVRIHQAPLPDHHVNVRSGWRVTNIERTLVDLGKVESSTVQQRCIEDAVIDRRTTMARIEAMFGEVATRGRPGIARTRTVLSRLDPEPPTESELEAMFLRAVRRRSLAVPQTQARFDWLLAGAGRVDFWYPDERVIVELDGRRFHLRAAAFESDRRRDLLALTHGIQTVRITHRQLTTETTVVMSALKQVLRDRQLQAQRCP